MRVLLLPFLATAVSLAAAQTIQVSKDNRTIAITATDEAQAGADLAAVNIGFDTFGSDQTQTYAEATRISNAVNAALQSGGIKPEAIESRDQNLSPVGEEDRTRFAKGIRFHVSQSWTVTVPAASAAATLHSAILAGANNSGNIQWKLANDDALEAAAATKALEHARQIADRMARGLGSKLGALVYASNQAPERGFPGPVMRAFSAKAASPSSLQPLAISPEKISRSATVYAVFSIE